MDQHHLESIRQAEIDLVKQWFRPGIRVLEIGGGNGFQAAVIASWGCQVTSIDVGQVSSDRAAHYLVQHYDGKMLPFSDHSFDAVFSSNVLEHIPHLQLMLNEIMRVLKRDGIVVHILPSSSWRFWTSLSFYMHLIRVIVGVAAPALQSQRAPLTGEPLAKRGWGALARRALFDGPHGEFPSALHELHTFSKFWWIRMFRKNGFEVKHCCGNGLFYTGYAILSGTPLRWRRWAARCLGSAATIYVLRER